MIKNIYDKKNNYYKHEYYCDNCFSKIRNGSKILRHEKAIKDNKLDLCINCKIAWMVK